MGGKWGCEVYGGRKRVLDRMGCHSFHRLRELIQSKRPRILPAPSEQMDDSCHRVRETCSRGVKAVYWKNKHIADLYRSSQFVEIVFPDAGCGKEISTFA